MGEYVYANAGERLDDLVKDAYVCAVTAREGRLNTRTADGVVGRLRAAAGDMVEPGDRDLLRTMANRLELVGARVKAGGLRPRVKAAEPVRPTIAEMIAADTAEQMARGGRFDRTESERLELERVAEANRQLAARNRKAEEERRRR